MAFGETLHDELVERFPDDAEELFDFMETPVAEVFPASVAGVRGDPLPELRRKLRDGESTNLAFAAIGFLGEKAVPAIPDLVALLDDDDLRADAAQTLGAIGSAATEAVPALEPYLEDPSYQSRSATIEALWRITGDTRYRDLEFAPAEIQAGATGRSRA